MQEVSQFHYPLGTITPCQPCIKHQASITGYIENILVGSKTNRQHKRLLFCCPSINGWKDGGKDEEGGGGVRNTAQYNNK